MESARAHLGAISYKECNEEGKKSHTLTLSLSVNLNLRLFLYGGSAVEKKKKNWNRAHDSLSL